MATTRISAVFSAADASSPLSIAPAHTAVLLMDYQNMIVSRLGDSGPQVLNTANRIRDWALQKGMSVFHCLIDTQPGARPPEHMRLATRWKMYEEHLANKPSLGHEAPALAPKGDSERERTFTRTPGFVSVLESNGLEEVLREKGIKSLILGGISTSGCVLSTVRAASDRGYIATVIEDACFDPTPSLHDSLAAHIFPATAHVATANEVMSAWESQ